MLGWPIQVDEESIRLRQSVHMLLACRNLDKLKGAVQLFHKKLGYNIGMCVEDFVGPAGSVPPPPLATGLDEVIDELGTRYKESDEPNGAANMEVQQTGPPAATPSTSMMMAPTEVADT
jgi:hypothetical protein